MPGRITQTEEFQEVAGACFTYLINDPQELANFMGFAGFTPDALRAAVDSDALNRGLIDYFAQNEPVLLAMCANSGMQPERLMRLWQRLNPHG